MPSITDCPTRLSGGHVTTAGGTPLEDHRNAVNGEKARTLYHGRVSVCAITMARYSVTHDGYRRTVKRDKILIQSLNHPTC